MYLFYLPNDNKLKKIRLFLKYSRYSNYLTSRPTSFIQCIFLSHSYQPPKLTHKFIIKLNVYFTVTLQEHNCNVNVARAVSSGVTDIYKEYSFFFDVYKHIKTLTNVIGWHSFVFMQSSSKYADDVASSKLCKRNNTLGLRPQSGFIND